eukprot:1977320-Pyramimonas_sp.AAC.1
MRGPIVPRRACALSLGRDYDARYVFREACGTQLRWRHVPVADSDPWQLDGCEHELPSRLKRETLSPLRPIPELP